MSSSILNVSIKKSLKEKVIKTTEELNISQAAVTSIALSEYFAKKEKIKKLEEHEKIKVG